MEGTVGTGKTSVLQALTEQVLDSDALVLSAVCSRLEQDQQFAVVRELLQGVEPPTKATLEAARRLDEDTLAAMLGGPGPSTAGPVAGRVHNDFFTTLYALAEQRPLVITIDDVQHMDSASARCLLHAVRRLRSARVTTVVYVESASAYCRRRLSVCSTTWPGED